MKVLNKVLKFLKNLALNIYKCAIKLVRFVRGVKQEIDDSNCQESEINLEVIIDDSKPNSVSEHVDKSDE